MPCSERCRMRCSVCGRNPRFHKLSDWGLFKRIEGQRKLELTAGPMRGVSKCGAIQIFQSHLLAGVGELRKIKAAD
jgi:hypothetical protein